MSAFGHGIFVAAGPWLATTAGLATISLLGGAWVGSPAIEDLRVIIIYAFAFGFIGTAPAAMVGTRRLADCLYVGRFEDAPGIFVRTLALGAVTTTGLVAALALLLGWFTPLVLPTAICAILVGSTWVASAFCGATRDYRAIAGAVALGICVSVVLTLWAATSAAQTAQLVWTYCAGTAITTGLLSARVLATFPFQIARIGSSPQIDVRLLGAGATLGALALWGDRFAVWASPLAVRTPAGLVHAPLYDGAMFIASLSLIPGLALFVIHLETAVSSGLRRLNSAILDHAPLHQIEAAALDARRSILGVQHRIVLLHAVVCLTLVTFAGDALPLIGLDSRQVAIARLGMLAALFQFVFYASTAVILFLDRRRDYAILQSSMLVSSVVLTVLTVELDVRLLGLGVLAASLANGLAAYLVMVKALEQLEYGLFVGALFRTRRGGSGSRSRWRVQRPARSASAS